MLFITASNGFGDRLWKRQVVAYTSNVAHKDPQYPDQSARSTVSVSFNTNHQQDLKKTPRYTSSFQKSPTFDHPLPTPVFRNTQIATVPHGDNGNTQLFNVGYSVRFQGKSTPIQRDVPTFMRPNLDNGEIITGTRKANEQVSAPQAMESTQQLTVNSLDEKKHKLSGIKPKPKFQVPLGKPEKVYLAPQTQKYLKQLEQGTKPLFKSTEDAKKYHDQTYSWRNLGPSVEIIRSSEIPATSQEFDHSSALGRSQSFDFSNGVDINQPSATSSYPSFNYQTNTQQQFLPPISTKVETKPLLFSQIPTTTPPVNQGVAKFPLDTSLLRDPYVTTNINNVPKTTNVVPIHFNVRPLEEVMKNHLQAAKNNLEQTIVQSTPEYYQNPIPQPQPYSQYAQNIQYNQQVRYEVPQSPIYQTLHKDESQEYEQQHHQEEDSYLSYGQQDQKYQNYDSQEQVYHQEYNQNQNKQQYKIYGKPKPLKTVTVKYSHKGHNKDIHRQPRILPNPYKMVLSLRPPPAKHTQIQRKVLVNYY